MKFGFSEDMGDGIFSPGNTDFFKIFFPSLKARNFFDMNIVENRCYYSSGGSLSNMYGMVLARYQKFPEIKTKGMIGGDVAKPLVAFTSEEAHYSISKAAGWLGIGTENVVKVKTDQRGRMIPDELSSAIGKTKSEGKIPFFVNCTSGTTVMGAFDPLRELIGVCREHEVWAHVDACWGGTVILSEKHKYIL